MGALDRGVGIARSLLIYHLIPRRQRKLTRLYRTFVRPGDLAFDVGAHAGNRVRALLATGCRVVAVEPQPDFVRLLTFLFKRSPRVTIVPAAAAARTGTETIWLSTRHPTLATSAPAWREQRSQEPGFAGVQWDRSIQVEATTLDMLIARFGEPVFVKIDVEGAEPAVLAGLSRPIATVSFEYLPGALDEVGACLDRLSQLGPYEFNWSAGESFQLASESWLNTTALLDALRPSEGQRTSGDVYARLRS
jgi:FkbM family methyltransferase